MNLNKKKFTGVFLAENEKQLAAQLAQQNLYLISAKVAPDSPSSSFINLGNKIKLPELTTFCRQFSTMSNAGLSIVQILDVLKNQDFDKFFKSILENVYEDVKAGVMLSDALAKHKKVFPNFFKSMIKVGEASGKLDIVMVSLADYYETDAAIRKKTKGAMVYPLMLLLMTIGIVILMMLFVVPTFKKTLVEMNVEMPPLTQAISDLSDFIKAKWKQIIITIVSIIVLLKIFGMTQKGRYVYDTLAINIPLLKTINIARITARFARGFSLLLSSGMDIVESLEEISAVLGNKNVEKRFKLATEDIRQGMTMTMAFESYKLFPDILIQMISVGERTAAVEDVLSRSCTFFDEQAESALNAFTSAINPIMLLIMGGVVGVLFIAIYSPMLQIMTTIGK